MKKPRSKTTFRRFKLTATGPNGKPAMLRFEPGDVVAIHEKNSRRWPRFTQQTLVDVLYAIARANEPVPVKPITPQLEFPFDQFQVCAAVPAVPAAGLPDLPPIAPPITPTVDRPF
jgi:hypothetical protein